MLHGRNTSLLCGHRRLCGLRLDSLLGRVGRVVGAFCERPSWFGGGLDDSSGGVGCWGAAVDSMLGNGDEIGGVLDAGAAGGG